MRGELGKEIFWSPTLRSRRIYTRQKSMLEDSMKKKSLRQKMVEILIFPIADGTVKLCGGDQVIRKSTSMRDEPERGEELRDDLRGESDGSPPVDTTMDGREVRNVFLVDRRELHLSSSRRTKSSALCTEGRNIPNTNAIQ